MLYVSKISRGAEKHLSIVHYGRLYHACVSDSVAFTAKLGTVFDILIGVPHYKVAFFKRSKKVQYFFNMSIDGADALKNIYHFYTGKNKGFPNYYKMLTKQRMENATVLLFDNEQRSERPLKNFISLAALIEEQKAELSTQLYTRLFDSSSERIRKGIKNADDLLAFDLDLYCEMMECKPEESSYLFILDPVRFIEELKLSIPKAVEANYAKLTDERFYSAFNPKDAVLLRNVDYSRHNKSELFYDNPGNCEEIFWKMPEYAFQSEVRIIIPNINFQQAFCYPQPYDATENSLIINLPHLKEYAKVFPASEAHTLLF